MKTVASLAAAALVCGLGSVASAAELYNETFSTDGSVSSYVGAGKIFAATTATSGMTASGGKLSLGYLANIGADSAGSVASDLGGNQSLVSLKVDLTPQSYSAGSFRLIVTNTTDLVWVGWGFNDRAWADVRVDASGIGFQEGAAVPFTMSQSHTLALFLNDSGASQSYTGPDGNSYTVADKTWSVFDGTTPLGQNIAKLGAPSISYVGMLAARNWGGAETMTDVDNLVIRNDLSMPVPEPATLGLLAVSGMLFMRRRPA